MDQIDLYASHEAELELEELAEGNALSSASTGSSVGSASCPATSASSFTSFSCMSG
ncbi:thiocillin family RiPP [Nesterenkonia alkaliphila]|uniref:Thiocillin family RiPP n=1 Tax=Nesterenkonia alkaliphila TaxID=1463631 RepID=A0A7K1UJ61_9MICC|nr:thiocillin family RiPP [Nesterenkonia alkaliphila]MVT26525.1 thiocillin family RiPP [Nesterenkonia alkaliphila]GFZ79137.1 hypothetical protein GCM10011359_04410 [Nesterenkonia alkaliphila]